ncbi:MAG: DegV family protein [Bacillota bacterium]|nr:DegV family protein [Bacillota bacterium]
MEKYAIVTDSCCDMPYSYIKENNIPFASLTMRFKDKEYKDDFKISMDADTFYKYLKDGIMPATSQANVNDFYNMFSEALKESEKVLYIGVSSGLSGTVNSATLAKKMIEEDGEHKVYIVDTLTASLGQGILLMKAVNMQKEGKSIDEVYEYLLNERFKLNTYITVDDLKHLKNGGRISNTAAAIGIVLHIKPVMTLNNEGRIIPCLKIKGRKKVMSKLKEIVAERIESKDIIAICHAQCLDEAEKLKSDLMELGIKEVLINEIGPVVGTHGGPGAMGIFFFGKERQNHVI